MIVRKDECDDWLFELIADPNVSDAWFDNFGGFELVSHFNLCCFEAKAPTMAVDVTPLGAGQSRRNPRPITHSGRETGHFSGSYPAMTAILIFGEAVGAILGRCDFKVFALVPVTLLIAAGAVAIGSRPVLICALSHSVCW
jgi:hypothetical protein